MLPAINIRHFKRSSRSVHSAIVTDRSSSLAMTEENTNIYINDNFYQYMTSGNAGINTDRYTNYNFSQWIPENNAENTMFFEDLGNIDFANVTDRSVSLETNFSYAETNVMAAMNNESASTTITSTTAPISIPIVENHGYGVHFDVPPQQIYSSMPLPSLSPSSTLSFLSSITASPMQSIMPYITNNGSYTESSNLGTNGDSQFQLNDVLVENPQPVLRNEFCPNTTVQQHEPSAAPAQSTKKLTESELQTKKAIRLYKNRQAAKQCRNKKKKYIERLETQINVLETHNKTLIDQLWELKELYCKQLSELS